MALGHQIGHQALILGIILLALSACGQPDPLAYSKSQLELQQAQQAAERAEARRQALEPFDRALGAAWRLALAALPLVALGIGIDAYRQRRRPLIRPDARGLLPVVRAEIETGQLADAFTAALAAYHQKEYMRVLFQPQPQPHTYSPRFDIQQAAPVISQPQTIPESPALPAAPPTFAQLLDNGTIHRGAPLILGYSEGQPLTGSWKDLYSSAIAGVSGSGKTTTIRFLACQSALHGARFVVIDPHLDTGDESLAATLSPLQHTMLCAPAGSDRPILQAVRLVKSQLDARLRGDKTRSPLVLAVDEFTRCMRSSAIAHELAGLIEAIGQEGRKVGVFAMLAGHVWSAERAGGTPLRDALASCYVHRIKRRQANMLLQLGDELPETLMLPTGTAYLYRTSGKLETVAIPFTSKIDVEHVAGLLEATSKPARNQLEIETKEVSIPLQSPERLDAETVRIVELFRAGSDVADIVRELWPEAKAGSSYQKRSAEVQAVLRRRVK